MATIEKITPAKGKVGNTAVLHGAGLQGSSFEIKFGRALAPNAGNPGNSPENIKCEVPTKHALDPATVTVTVSIDGTPADASGLTFDYGVPQPEPVILTAVPTFDPLTRILKVEMTGTGFVTPTRQPDNTPAPVTGRHNVFVTGSATRQGKYLDGFTATSMTAEFPGALTAGTFRVVAGFTDGSAATSPEFEY